MTDPVYSVCKRLILSQNSVGWFSKIDFTGPHLGDILFGITSEGDAFTVFSNDKFFTLPN